MGRGCCWIVSALWTALEFKTQLYGGQGVPVSCTERMLRQPATCGRDAKIGSRLARNTSPGTSVMLRSCLPGTETWHLLLSLTLRSPPHTCPGDSGTGLNWSFLFHFFVSFDLGVAVARGSKDISRLELSLPPLDWKRAWSGHAESL